MSSDRLLTPSKEDLRHVKRFLTEIADVINRRVGDRLAVILSGIHQANRTLFSSREAAAELAIDFQRTLTVDDATASPQ